MSIGSGDCSACGGTGGYLKGPVVEQSLLGGFA